MKAVTGRVDLWQNNLEELLEEARAIQKRLPSPSLNKCMQKDKARNFTGKMRHGEVLSALRELSEEQSGGMLPLTREIIHLMK